MRKLISWIVTAAVVVTNAAILSVPVVSAETVDTDTLYSENFDGFENKNYSPTLTALKEYGWYAADYNTLYTTVDNVGPYKTYSGKFAKITTVDNSKVLQISSAGEGDSTQSADIPKYGYAKTFPGVAAGEAATGSWEINFDFKPYLVNNTTQFAFTLNTGDGSASADAAAQHNIIAGYGQKFYLGYRDYNALLNNNVKQGILAAADIGGVTWYRVRTILNCDARYYTVELYNRETGKLIARRSPVSFAADETIGFLKFSALGYKQKSTVYIDNVSIEKIARQATIYEETFDTFTNGDYRAEDGIIISAETAEDFTGNSYFEGHTPWRFYENVGNSYALENDETLSSQVVRLGDNPETAEKIEASGLVYMQGNEMLITQTTEERRGLLKIGFKIKPETIADDVTLNIAPAVKCDITNNDYSVFKITNDEGVAKFVRKNGEDVELDGSKWYDVEITFNVVDRKVTTTVKDLEGNGVADNAVTGNNATPTAVKAFMLKVDGGSSVLVDDIKLEYATIPPSINKNKIVATDCFGEKITDTENVPTSLKTIEIPMGCPVTPETANSSTILLTDSKGSVKNYTGTLSGSLYIMELNSALGLNEEYTITVPKTVANAYGDELGKEVTFTFKTVNNPMDISAVSVNDVPFNSFWDITPGSTVSVTMSYANDKDEVLNSKVILAFYGDKKLVDIQSLDFAIQPGEHGVDEKTVAFTVPANIDMDVVDRISVLVWDGFIDMHPLAQRINFDKKIGEAGKYRDYVDFEVNVENGREPVILQITDTQIIDSGQRREGKLNNTAAINYWLPELMSKRLFDDLKTLVNEVNPDLILMTGDLVYGGYDDAGTSLTKLADFMDELGIPWAPVFGNHDNESKMGVDWQCEYLENCKNCLFKQRTLTGNGNYSIGIVQGGELKRVIFMLDSNGCGAMSDESFENGHSKKEDGFGEDQVEWYTSAAEKINQKFGQMKYTFAFHIQLYAFEDALRETYGFDNNGEVAGEGLVYKGDFVNPINIDEREDKKDTDFGYIGRKLKTPWDKDKTVYNGMKALGADSILVGHEHCNSASVVYDGIRFQYGQKTGEYDRINFKTPEGSENPPIIGASAYNTNLGTPVLGGTVMKLSETTGEISNAYIHYTSR